MSRFNKVHDRTTFCVMLFTILLMLGSSMLSHSKSLTDRQTYVIVPGMTGGGWDWKNVGALIEKSGATVYRCTLTGLGERVHLASTNIDLSTHISDVVNTILYEELHNVVLVGHSYAGLVITGVMDRIPERIKSAIFLDAWIPKDGDTGAAFMLGYAGYTDDQLAPISKDGNIVTTWVKSDALPPKDNLQSFKTMTEPVSYKNPLAFKIPTTVVWFVPDASDPSAVSKRISPEIHNRLKARKWPILTLESDHNAQSSHPDELAEILIALGRQTQP